jgi:hypothetical protein
MIREISGLGEVFCLDGRIHNILGDLRVLERFSDLSSGSPEITKEEADRALRT